MRNTKKTGCVKTTQMESEVCVMAPRENSWRAIIDMQKLKVASPSEFGKVKNNRAVTGFRSFFLFLSLSVSL